MENEPKKIVLPKSDEQLLALCRVETFRARGAGGQHVNTTDSAVRLTYLPHRLVVSSQKERSQHLNKKECVRKLREKVAKLNYRAPKRVSTKVPKSQKEKRLLQKKQHGEKKRLRIKNLNS